MEILKLLNLGLRFLLELCILVIFSYWGFKTGGNGKLMKFLLGIGSPILIAIIWGIFLAPKSSMQLGEPWLLLLELIIFGLTCWALYNTGNITLTVAFGFIYILNKILIIIWRQ
ncbi:MAG: hypothetical protein CVU46_00915 [Chloroflexi bacterium HGW-Chloroflexi-8]|jgi:hypothetical protein|nr:MAG: hypothetical protein CVU46_00915 [Chloroflexi bacterium HGW-Chloroflexi-8]